MKVLVLSGTHREFVDYLDKNNIHLTHCYYLDRIERLYGLHDFVVIRIGTWSRRKDIYDIGIILATRRCLIVEGIY